MPAAFPEIEFTQVIYHVKALEIYLEFSLTPWNPFGTIALKTFWLPITLTPYMVLLLFSTRFADYAGGIRVSFIQARLF